MECENPARRAASETGDSVMNSASVSAVEPWCVSLAGASTATEMWASVSLPKTTVMRRVPVMREGVVAAVRNSHLGLDYKRTERLVVKEAGEQSQDTGQTGRRSSLHVSVSIVSGFWTMHPVASSSKVEERTG